MDHCMVLSCQVRTKLLGLYGSLEGGRSPTNLEEICLELWTPTPESDTSTLLPRQINDLF